MQQAQVQWVADRSLLRTLKTSNPSRSLTQLALACDHSRSWVKKWLKRFKQAPPADEAVLYHRPSLPKTPRPPTNPLLVERILELRQNPPANLKRIPGPKTLAYYLQSDPLLKEFGINPPRSTSTIWRILVNTGCIDRERVVQHEPLELPEPLECIAIDFKDATVETIDPAGKKQHLIEVLNFVDEGPSVLWEAVVREDFNAETVVETLLEVFEKQGLPRRLRFDRDTRFVGASQGKDFPSALLRMLRVLNIQPCISPPHHPEKNP